jgi:hypothetical protein
MIKQVGVSDFHCILVDPYCCENKDQQLISMMINPIHFMFSSF